MEIETTPDYTTANIALELLGAFGTVLWLPISGLLGATSLAFAFQQKNDKKVRRYHLINAALICPCIAATVWCFVHEAARHAAILE